MTSSLETSPSTAMRRVRWIANGLLLLMTAGFIVARAYEGHIAALGFLRAFCEAAMIGALADWFAVTALFRHPLGLPIPHTAIIPKNKERLGRSLGLFIQSNFLSEDVLAGRLEKIDLLGQALRWMATADNLPRFSQRIAAALPRLVAALDDKDVEAMMLSTFREVADELDVAALLSTLLDFLVSDGRHAELVDELLAIADRLLASHQSFIQDTLREEMPWYVPSFVHDHIYKAVLRKIESRILNLKNDPVHPARNRFGVFLQKFAAELRTDDILRGKCEATKRWIFSSPALSNYVERLWQDLKRLFTKDLIEDNSKTLGAIERFLAIIVKQVGADADVQMKINALLRENTRVLVRSYRDPIVELIAGTVRTWETKTLIDKLELEVGRDLQYIRLNGTLVGGMVGLLLYVLTR